MNVETTIYLHVNGKEHTISAPPGWNLARVLREKLGLTGTKLSCEQGDCGACTVILDGDAVHACLVPAVDAQGRKILTIEGLSKGGELHFVQRAFMKAGAIQCGFCTPGMVMAVAALYWKNDDPTEEEIQTAIAGNLCRCTGYKKILGVAEVIRRERAGLEDVPVARQVGASLIRKDSFAKVTGRAQYVNDLHMDNMLYGAIFRSPVPFGRVRSLDVTEARRLPGVELVLTAEDVGRHRWGPEVADQQLFASDVVRYTGDPLAAVAAIDPETAEAALRLIKVDIEPYEPNLEAPESMKPGARVIHEDYDQYRKSSEIIPGGTDGLPNICFRSKVHVGEVEAAFARADLVYEDCVTSHRTHPGYIEPHGALCYLDEHNRLNIVSSFQKPYFVRTMLSKILGIPQSRIRSRAATVGGGFGGKTAILPEPYCAVLTLRTGKPVKIITSREEELIAAANRHKIHYKIRSGVMRDGTLVARKIEIISDAGAYTIDSPGGLNLAIYSACGPYRYENLEVDAFCVYTNTVPAGSNRAPAGLPSVFAIETHTDALARRLGMDPLAFRLKNILRNGDKAFNGQVMKNCSLEECLRKVAERLDWDQGNKVGGLGKGLSCMWWCSGNFPGSAMVGVNDDGSVQILSGFNEIGTGSKVTAIPQIAAEALGVNFDLVSVSDSDTDSFSYDHGVGASRMVHSIGKAVLLSCEQIKEKLAVFLVGEGLLEDANIRFDCGKVLHPVSGRFWPLGEAAAMYKIKNGPLVGQASINVGFPPYEADRLEGFIYPSFPAPSFVAQGAVVRRDGETGLVEVRKMVAAQDVGYAINPIAIEGQIEGGLMMGLSYALMEEQVIENGQVRNVTFHDYKIPTAKDLPELETIIVERAEEEDSGPMGAKGVAESALAPTAGAIANALYALDGLKSSDTRLQLLRDKI